MVERFSKPVSQYALDGSRLGTWPNARAAEKATGVFFGTISDSCRGRLQRVGTKSNKDGMTVFRFGEDESIPPVVYRHPKCRMIAQFGRGREFIRAYRSAKEAAEVSGINVTCIRDAARGVQDSAGGFRWRYTSEKEFGVL